MAREISDFTKIPLTKAFQAKGTVGSNLNEELQPVVVAHTLDDGPNFASTRWTGTCQVAAVAAQLAEVNIRVVQDPTAAVVVEQLLVIDWVWSDIAVRVGMGHNDALSTPVGQMTCFDHDIRRSIYDGGFSTWRAAPLNDIVSLFGNGSASRVNSVMGRNTPNVPLPLWIVMPRRLENAQGSFGTSVPTFYIEAETVNVAMRVHVSGRLFFIKP